MEKSDMQTIEIGKTSGTIQYKQIFSISDVLMGMNFNDVGIAHHKQRRVIQRQRVGHQLFQSRA